MIDTLIVMVPTGSISPLLRRPFEQVLRDQAQLIAGEHVLVDVNIMEMSDWYVEQSWAVYVSVEYPDDAKRTRFAQFHGVYGNLVNHYHQMPMHFCNMVTPVM